jgi:hypothetical protein
LRLATLVKPTCGVVAPSPPCHATAQRWRVNPQRSTFTQFASLWLHCPIKGSIG